MTTSYNSLLSIFFLGLSFTAFGQYKFAPDSSVSVWKNGSEMREPWAGGMNNPQFNEMDVDFDCVTDLVIFDRATNGVKVYINNNIPNEVSYRYAPEYSRFFPKELVDFLIVRDYNNDQKPDLISYRPGGFRVWKNVSDSTLKFELFSDRLPAIVFGNVSNVYCIPIDYPVFDDINGDGLLDVLALNVFGTFISFYENVSTHPDSFVLERTNTCWGNFFENQLTDSLVLNAQCKGGGSTQSGAQRHTGASMLTLDLYGNGLKDLLLSDLGYSNLIQLRNGGTIGEADMISVDYHYAGNGSKVVDFPTFPLPFFMDVNNNGRKDLIVTSNQRDGGLDTGNVWFYDNFGLNNNPNFAFDSDNLLVGEQIDVGTGAFPVLADISGDGLNDLIIGHVGYFDSFDSDFLTTEYTSSLAYYKNVGTDSVPVFEWVTNDLAGISAKGFVRIAPTIADIDGDGDNDLLFGENNGSLSFYRNVASSGQMADFQLEADTFMGQLFGVQPSPFWFDVDNDGLLDLMVGQKNGNIHLYLNQGDSINPLYTVTVTDTMGGIYNYYPAFESNAMPIVAKVKSSESYQLIVADGIGNVRFYDGIQSNWNSAYTLTDSIRVSNSYIGVAGADLNGNDSLELIVGERTGGLLFFAQNEAAYNYNPYPRDTCVISSIREPRVQEKGFAIIPNPTSGEFRMELAFARSSQAVISIYDLTGKLVFNQGVSVLSGDNNISVQPSNLPQGVYVVTVRSESEQYRSKLVVQ